MMKFINKRTETILLLKTLVNKANNKAQRRLSYAVHQKKKKREKGGGGGGSINLKHA